MTAAAGRPGHRVRAALAVLLLHPVALLVMVYGFGVDRALAFGPCTAVHLVATAAWVVVVHAVVRGRWLPPFRTALAVAVVLRLAMAALPPALSDDVYRYMHEGHLVVQGVDPYAHAPADPGIAHLRGAYWERINHPDIPAAYPPAVQGAAALAALAQPGARERADPFPWAWKAVFAGCDLLAFAALWWWLRRRGLPPARALVHGACPLMALEFAAEVHSDSLAVAFLVLGGGAAAAALPRTAGALLAVATAGKYLPAVALPFLRDWRAVVPFAGVVVLLWLPFLGGDAGVPFEGITHYTARWRSNDTLYGLFDALAPRLFATGSPVAGTPEIGRVDLLARLPLAVLGIALLATVWWRRWPMERALLAFFVFFVACAPTVHPWYVAFLVPFLAFRPNPGWLAFTGTVYLAYHVLPGWHAEGRWEENGWIVALEYAPFYAGVLGEGWRWWAVGSGGR